jgi:acylphosphatase
MKVGIFRVKVRAYITVFGRIQGVFFRSWTCREAQNHNVSCWVRNLADGRVEGVFEGEDKTVQKLVEFCKVGPLGARVDSVNVILQEYIGEFMDFHIKW